MKWVEEPGGRVGQHVKQDRSNHSAPDQLPPRRLARKTSAQPYQQPERTVIDELRPLECIDAASEIIIKINDDIRGHQGHERQPPSRSAREINAGTERQRV